MDADAANALAVFSLIVAVLSLIVSVWVYIKD